MNGPMGRLRAENSAEASRALLEGLGVPEEETPVLVMAGQVLRRPTVEEVADAVGLRPALDLHGFVLSGSDLIAMRLRTRA